MRVLGAQWGVLGSAGAEILKFLPSVWFVHLFVYFKGKKMGKGHFPSCFRMVSILKPSGKGILGINTGVF